jgi:hypothetical protein
MEKKNDSTILLLLAAGLGVYWLTRKKPIATAMPVDDMPKSTQPVVEQPVTEQPTYFEKYGKYPTGLEYIEQVKPQSVYNEQISTQPIYEQPIYVAPIMDQPAQSIEFTPVTDMFNTVWQPNYNNKTPMEPVFNMNIEPVE